MLPRPAPIRLLRTAAVAALATLGFASPAAAAELGLVTDLTWGASAADQEREYAALTDLGARWVRVEVNWAEVEPQQGAYHAWSLGQIDAAVRRNRAAGRQVVVMIGKSPAWASGASTQGAPPRDPADYARFVGFLAARYANDGVAGYEIWNEENIGRFWNGSPDPAAYVRLLRAASAAVRAADPGAKVVFGGTSTNDYEFIRRAYAAGAKGLFDVMALHPYSCESDIGAVKRDASGRIAPGSFLGYRAIRDLMVAEGDPQPMWFTEVGWATTSKPCGVSEAGQAQRIAASAALVAQDSYVQAVMYYNLRNNYWMGDADDVEAQYGLMTTGFRAKAGYAALKAAAAGAPAPSPAPEAPAQPAPTPAAPAPAPAPKAPARPRRKPRITISSVRSRGAIHLRGRVAGVRSGARVRVSVKRHGRRLVRVVRAHRGHFTASLRRVPPGRWRVVATVAHPARARAATVLVVR